MSEVAEIPIPTIDEAGRMFQQSIDQDKPISELQAPKEATPEPKEESKSEAAKELPKEQPKEAPKEEAKPEKKDPLSKMLPKKEKPAEEPKPEAKDEKPIDWKTAPKEFRERHEKLLTEHKTTAAKVAEYEKQVQSLNAKIAEIGDKGSDATKAELKLVEEYTAKLAEKEARIRELDYSSSQEYKDLVAGYQEKYNQRYTRAFTELKGFQVTVGDPENPQTRNFSEDDLRTLLNKPLAEQRRITRSLFREDADVVNRHLDALSDIKDSANHDLSTKLNEARANGEIRAKEARLAEEKQTREYQQHTESFRKQFETEYPDYFTAPKDDQEAASHLETGHEFAESLRNTSNLTLQERAEKATAAHMMIASWPMQNHRLKVLSEKYESVMKELEALRGSDPGNAGEKPGGKTGEPEILGIEETVKRTKWS